VRAPEQNDVFIAEDAKQVSLVYIHVYLHTKCTKRIRGESVCERVCVSVRERVCV
jgi:hypothetical protein